MQEVFLKINDARNNFMNINFPLIRWRGVRARKSRRKWVLRLGWRGYIR